MDDAQNAPDAESSTRNSRDIFEERCREAGLEFEVPYEGKFPPVEVRMPAGKGMRAVFIGNEEKLEAFLNVQFERYVWLGTYIAVASFGDDQILAAVRELAHSGGTGSMALFGNEEAPLAISSGDGRRVTLEPITSELVALTPDRRWPWPAASPSIGLKLEGFGVTEHDRAIEVLEQAADSVFMQVELERDVALGVARTLGGFRPPRKGYTGQPMPLRFPELAYDRAAMKLYWYARQAAHAPLLQYLAYYQVLEHYFPFFGRMAACKKVQAVLKDHDLDYNRNPDVERVVEAAQYPRKERDQLRAALREYVDAEGLRAFLMRSQGSASFFKSRNTVLAVGALPVGGPAEDLARGVADRVYGIRCRIVHTKAASSEDENAPILPGSAAEASLGYDIDLVQYLARTVLTARKPMRSFFG